MAMAEFAVGYVGSGAVGWMLALRDVRRARLLAVADPDPRDARIIGTRSYARLQDMIGSEKRLQGIVLGPSPTGDRTSELRQALEAGLHVLLDRPVAAPDEVDLVSKLRQGRLLLVAGNIHHPLLAWARQKFRDIGGVQRIEATWWRRGELATTPAWYELSALLMSVMSLGKSPDLQCEQAQQDAGVLKATLRWTGGVPVEVLVGTSDLATPPELRISGAHGGLHLPFDLSVSGPRTPRPTWWLGDQVCQQGSHWPRPRSAIAAQLLQEVTCGTERDDLVWALRAGELAQRIASEANLGW